MTLFEYIAVAYSLIVAIGVGRMIGGVAAIWMSDTDHWPVRLWSGLNLIGYFGTFWIFWGYRAVEQWNAGASSWRSRAPLPCSPPP